MRRAGLSITILLTACSLRVRSSYAPRDLYGPPRIPPATYAEYVRGRLASLEGRHDEAIVAFHRATNLAPDEPELHGALAGELLASGRIAEARRVARHMRTRWPNHPDGWLVEGRVLTALGDSPAARRAFERAEALEGPSAAPQGDRARR